jgi:hypothetical protein
MDVLSKEYLDWVSESTKDGKTIFYSVDISKTKESGIEELFKRVDGYAKKFYYFNVEEFGSKYNITDRRNFYTISMLYGPDVAYRLERDEGKANYIDLNDVKMNVIRGRENLEVSNRMKAIALHLSELSKMGVPMDLVETETVKEIHTLKLKRK